MRVTVQRTPGSLNGTDGCYLICAFTIAGSALDGPSCTLLALATLSPPGVPVDVVTQGKLCVLCCLYSIKKGMPTRCYGPIYQVYMAAMGGCLLSKISYRQCFLPLSWGKFGSSLSRKVICQRS